MKNKKLYFFLASLGIILYPWEPFFSFKKCFYHSKIAEFYVFQEKYEDALDEYSKILDLNITSHIDRGKI